MAPLVLIHYEKRWKRFFSSIPIWLDKSVTEWMIWWGRGLKCVRHGKTQYKILTEWNDTKWKCSLCISICTVSCEHGNDTKIKPSQAKLIHTICIESGGRRKRVGNRGRKKSGEWFKSIWQNWIANVIPSVTYGALEWTPRLIFKWFFYSSNSRPSQIRMHTHR